MKLRSIGLSVAFICAMPVMSWAGGVATIVSQDSQTQLEYDGAGLLRITPPGENAYMVMRDGRVYSVMSEGGDHQVFDVSQTMEMLGGLLAATRDQGLFDVSYREIVSLNDTGNKETVAGISGNVYELIAIDEDGQRITETLVLSSDRRVREMTNAMMAMSDVMMNAMGAEPAGYAAMKQQVLRDDRGVLRQGSDFRVASIDSTSPAASRFVLPAEPMDMSNMAGLFSGGMPDMSALFGGGSAETGASGAESTNVVSEQLERQQRRVGDRTDREIDQAADNVVDRTVNRVFRRVFGN